MSTFNILIAGFGGQGVLFAGKCLAYNGLTEGKNVSWLPSYGPEMRGGTASCSVILSDSPVGSPIVSNPNVLIALNLPSLDRYEKEAVAGAKIFVESSLIERKVERDDVEAFYIPATKMATDLGAPTLANMVILGKMIKETDVVGFDAIENGLKKVIPPKKADMLELNMKALKAGYDYEG